MHPHVIAGRWFTTALGVGAFLVVLPVRAEPPKPAPAGVPVVKTWGELRRAPLVEVWPGLSVRLGIEAAECPVAHGVFLYCLADGYAPPAPWSEEDRLGPLNMVVTNGVGKPLDYWQHGFGMEAQRDVPDDLAKCELLYLRRVVAPRPGAVRVRLEARPGRGDPRMVATADVKAAGAGHPFTRLQVVGPEPEPGQIEFRVRNSGAGPALPSWPEFCPVVGRGAAGGKEVRRDDSEPLPRLIPSEPSRALTLSLADGVLTVRTEDGTGRAGPEYHFLARWWVNGKPVVPAVPADPDLGVLGRVLTKEQRPEVRLVLHLSLEALKAKPGDLIGVQLLYCEYGHEAVSDRKLKILKGWDKTTFPVLSNRVEFRAK